MRVGEADPTGTMSAGSDRDALEAAPSALLLPVALGPVPTASCSGAFIKVRCPFELVPACLCVIDAECGLPVAQPVVACVNRFGVGRHSVPRHGEARWTPEPVVPNAAR